MDQDRHHQFFLYNEEKLTKFADDDDDDHDDDYDRWLSYQLFTNFNRLIIERRKKTNNNCVCKAFHSFIPIDLDDDCMKQKCFRRDLFMLIVNNNEKNPFLLNIKFASKTRMNEFTEMKWKKKEFNTNFDKLKWCLFTIQLHKNNRWVLITIIIKSNWLIDIDHNFTEWKKKHK